MKKIMNLLCRMEYYGYLCRAQEKDDGECYAVARKMAGALPPIIFTQEKDSGSCCLLSYKSSLPL